MLCSSAKIIWCTLKWRNTECDGVSNHQPQDNLLIIQSTDQRKHQSPASLAFVRGIHRWPVNIPTNKVPVTRKKFPFDDVIMSNRMRIMPSNRRLYSTVWFPMDPALFGNRDHIYIYIYIYIDNEVCGITIKYARVYSQIQVERSLSVSYKFSHGSNYSSGFLT